MTQFDYVKNTYGLSVHRGTRVKTYAGRGRVVGASNYVHVMIDGEKRQRRFHPQDIIIERAVKMKREISIGQFHYNDVRLLIKTIKDFGTDRKGIQNPKDLELIADYAKKILMKSKEAKK